MVQARCWSDDPHQDGAAFFKQRWAPLQPPLYLEQCDEVRCIQASKLLTPPGAQSESPIGDKSFQGFYDFYPELKSINVLLLHFSMLKAPIASI